MEECEALCSRIAIMVNGQLKCLGSSQHLKTKFGDGYTAIAKLRSSDMDSMQRQTKTMMDFIEQTFPGSTLKDKHNGLLHYQIPSSCATWSSVFAAMEQARKLVDIDDYAVSEVTLEQVFIGFAREQVPPEIITASCWSKLIGCCCCYCLRSDKSHQHDDETHTLPSTDRNGSAVLAVTVL
jgi:ATP-binding cassette subfamily A (ABC1) protein 3